MLVISDSIDTVFKGFGSKTVLEKKFKALGARNLEIESCKLTKSSLDVKFNREIPTTVPGLLKKFLSRCLNRWSFRKSI